MLPVHKGASDDNNLGTPKICKQSCADILRPMATVCDAILQKDGLQEEANLLQRVAATCPIASD